MSILDNLNEEMKEYATKSNFYKLQEGDNKLRILCEGSLIAKHFRPSNGKLVVSTCYGEDKGCPWHGDNAIKDEQGKEKKASIKYSCYVLDRVDGRIKLADLPYSVIKRIGEFQKDEDYSFDNFPMPYDVKITFKTEEIVNGKKVKVAPANMYAVIASPKREDLSDDIMGELAQLMSTADPKTIVQKQKDAQMSEDIKNGIWVDPATKPKTNLTPEQIANIKAIREAAIKQQEEAKGDIDPSDIPF